MSPNILERSRPRISILDFNPEQVVSRLREILEAKGVREAYLFGSFAGGTCKPWSDIDLVVVTETDLPFLERPRDFSELNALGVPIDLLVYSPAEFRRLRESDSPFWREFERQKKRFV